MRPFPTRLRETKRDFGPPKEDNIVHMGVGRDSCTPERSLWIGMMTGSTVQALLLALKTSFTNWEKRVIRTQKKKKNSFLYICFNYYTFLQLK